MRVWCWRSGRGLSLGSGLRGENGGSFNHKQLHTLSLRNYEISCKSLFLIFILLVPPFIHSHLHLSPNSQTHTPHRLHYAVQGYHELLKFIHEMTVSNDETFRENSKVMLSNLVYHQEYRDVFVSLLRNYNEVVQV